MGEYFRNLYGIRSRVTVERLFCKNRKKPAMDARGNKLEREKRGEAREWKSMRTRIASGASHGAVRAAPARASVFKAAIKKL